METPADASCLLFLEAAVVILLFFQRQDEEDRVPVHPVQLGEVWVEASLQPAQVACRLWHHLRGEDTSLALQSPASVPQAAALGMFLKLRPGGIPSQPCRAGGCLCVWYRWQGHCRRGCPCLLTSVAGNGSSINWDLWAFSRLLFPKAMAVGESSSNPSVLCRYRSHYSWKGLYPRPQRLLWAQSWSTDLLKSFNSPKFS